jgi:protein disulfide-isomerase-like protein
MLLTKLTLVLACLVAFASATDIITLDSSNFEKLTQAASGATTGDWLIKFYAPWCGHCKAMQPAFEETATALKGEVNVAEVDASVERQLGSRFEIRGFPTLIFLSQGKVVKYKGPRTVDALIEFSKGGWKEPQYEQDNVPAEMGYFGELTAVFKQSYKAALKDLAAGNYFTINILTCAMPLMFIGFALLLTFIPVDEEPVRRQPPVNRAKETKGE